MKKSHRIILLFSIVMALFSAYSLASSNTVNKIDIQRYSAERQSYYKDDRDTEKRKWTEPVYPKYMEFHILGNPDELVFLKGESSVKEMQLPGYNPEEELLFVGTLGEMRTTGSGIRISDMAQKGNVVEVKVDLWSVGLPEGQSNSKTKKKTDSDIKLVYPTDIVKVEKDDFNVKGKLLFIFKNQDGTPLFEQYYDVR